MRHVLVLLPVAMVLGCGGGETTLGENDAMASDRIPITGKNPQDVPNEDASNLSTESIAGAVARIGGCSATLIGRQVLLTAAHCTPRQYAEFAQSNNQFHIDDWKVHPYWDGENALYDIALAWLKQPVPLDVVNNIPRIFLGRLDRALEDGPGLGFDDDGLIVGYGRRTDCYTETCADPTGSGVRRWGIAKNVYTGVNWTLRHAAKESSEETINRGDSGGPIFLRKQPGDEYVVVGVASWIWWDGTNQTYSQWAITGSTSNGNAQETIFSGNTEWLLSELGGDEDSDDVLDELDNCPPSFCANRRLPMQRCHNPDQADEDGDVIGDACDNCPPSVCTPYKGRLDCRNYRQIDDDGDGIGDVCDLCPEQYSRDRNEDLNMNLVGDFCEDCPTAMRSPCSIGTAICTHNGGKCIFDYDGNGYILPGLCERPPDRDKDGVLDECDLCRDTYDGRNANANEDIELEDAYYSMLGDVCEPVPQLDFHPRRPQVSNLLPQPQWAGAEGLDWMLLEAKAIVARSEYGEPSAPTTIKLTAAFRHCSCFDTRKECDASEYCRPSAAASGAGSWRPINPVRYFQHNQEYQPAKDNLIEFSTSFSESEREQSAGVFAWSWLEDSDRGRIGWIQDGATRRTSGFLASVVDPNGPTFSNRDWRRMLRVVRRYIVTPYYESTEFGLNKPIPEICRPWDGCLNFMPSLRHIYEPWEWQFEDATPFVFVSDSYRIAIADERLQSLSMQLEEVIWMFLLQRKVVDFLPTLEDPSDRIVGVLVPRVNSQQISLSPTRVVADEYGLLMREEVMRPFGSAESASTALSETGKAFYSAKNDAVYFVGGRDLDGKPQATIRSFEFKSGTTRVLGNLVDLEEDGAVAGIAVDTRLRLVYALFINPRERERVEYVFVKINFNTGRSETIFRLSDAYAYEHVTLSLGDEGDVLFLAGWRGITLGWRYRWDRVGQQQGGFTGSWIYFESLLGPAHPSRPIVVTTDEATTTTVHRLRARDFVDIEPFPLFGY